jgi:hypothetical protein
VVSLNWAFSEVLQLLLGYHSAQYSISIAIASEARKSLQEFKSTKTAISLFSCLQLSNVLHQPSLNPSSLEAAQNLSPVQASNPTHEPTAPDLVVQAKDMSCPLPQHSLSVQPSDPPLDHR